MSADSKTPSLTPRQRLTNSTSDWLVPSPSLQQWGRRVLFYDMYCSLGAYERFKAFTLVALLVLLTINGRLHNERAKAVPQSSPDPPPAPAGIVFALMPWLHTIRTVAFWVLIYSYFYESFEASQRIRLLE